MIKNLLTLDRNTPNETDNNFQRISENDNRIYHGIKNICNLPVEIKQKVAFYLDSKSYGAFRLTFKIMSVHLPCFEDINNLLGRGCCGEIERNCRKMIICNTVRKKFEKGVVK
ncbi:MAG: hypothetical protein ACMZI0_14020 [Symbiopectobacterium sp.]|uniref:hypothetical protein n=1 Tax=Symbiopectobacterium sp. TaxID=2952789 RepID=UPI0039E8F20D